MLLILQALVYALSCHHVDT